MIGTLIVDDSPLIRTMIRDFLEADGEFTVIAEAENGRDGLEKAKSLRPDLITMDIDMPVMNGLEATAAIMREAPAPVVIVSSNSEARTAYEAAVKGAMEFFPKDKFTGKELADTLKRIARKKPVRAVDLAAGVAVKPAAPEPEIAARPVRGVVIASSTGGPKALTELCAGLPGNFPVPVALVQHNSSGFDRGFVQWLNGFTKLDVVLAEEGQVPVKGKFYVAPTDMHLRWKENGFSLDRTGPLVRNQKPAADVLFESAAALLGDALVSVVLTGMGDDGAAGTRMVKQAGGITIAQDEATSMIYGMPRAAKETGCVDLVLPLQGIAGRLVRLVS